MFYKKDCQEEFYGVKNEKNMSVTIKKDLIIQQNSAKETVNLNYMNTRYCTVILLENSNYSYNLFS